MAERSTTERTIKTRLDGESTGALRRAARAEAREIERLRRVAERENTAMQASFDRGATNILKATSTVTKGVFAIGSAVGSAQGIAGAAVTLAAMSGSLLALPGLALSSGAAVGVLALATQGFSDAIAAEDMEEFNKLTKEMAPAARDAALAIREQKDRFTELRRTVQGEFFDGVDDDIRELADTYFPLLNRETKEIAAGLNRMGRASLAALMAPGAVEDVNAVLDGTQSLLKELEPSIGNVLTGVLDLGAEGAEYTGRFGRAVNKVTEDFKKWVAAGVESGRINEIIDEGIDTAKDFGAVLGDVGQIGAKLWRGLSDGERDFLDGIKETTQAVEDFLDSAEGQEALKALGDTLRVTADVARDVLGSALRQLGPLVRDSAPAIQALVEGLGEFLVGAIETVGPLLRDLGGFLSENKDTVQDLVPLIIGLAVAYKGLNIAKDAAGWVAGLGVALGDTSKKAKDLDGAVGKGSKGGGGTGLAGSLAGLAALVGGGVAIDIINDSEIAKTNDFKISLEGVLDLLGKIGQNGAFGLMMKYNDAVIGGAVGAAKSLTNAPTTLQITADVSQAERSLSELKAEIGRSQESVTVNGKTQPAAKALETVIAAIEAGEGTVNINGNTIDSHRALDDIIALINKSTGTVKVDGTDVPAGQVLLGLLNRVNGSRAQMNIDANTSSAQGVIDGFISMNNGRTIQIYTSVLGSGGLASAGRLATGGRPFFDGRVHGPGTPTNDRAGLFALSRDEHVLNAAEVRALGGHQAVYRLRAMALNGQFRGFADGGTPRYLNPSFVLPSSASGGSGGAINVAAPDVKVFIDGEQFRGMVRVEIKDNERQVERKASTGPKGAW